MADGLRRRFSARAWLRAIHRDVGYFAVGLTFIYALSGLAVNHIADWDPNFVQIRKTHSVRGPWPDAPEEAARAVLARLSVAEPITDVYQEGDQLDIVLSERTFHLNRATSTVLEEGQKPRIFLRIANFLHLNRGKPAWKYVADAYAVFLLFLASSGLFMIKGRKGLLGRGAVIAIAGAAVPVLYVTLAGSP